MKKALAVLLVLCLCLSLTACGAEKPERAVENLLEAIKIYDQATIAKYLTAEELVGGTDEVDMDDEEVFKRMFKKLSYEIKGSSTEGDTATVDVELTAIDMKEIFGTYVDQVFALTLENAFKPEGEALSEEELKAKSKQVLIDLVGADDAKMVTTTVEFQLEKNEKSWKVKNNEDVADAVTGGMISTIELLKDSE
ncbi:MAG TPA: DUF4878 domain-containing protein [Clostridiales bacterium]|nr:DUF4878 domain-containing protein [Clostridiales bacterium]